MASQTVLESILDAVKPPKKPRLSKQSAVKALTLASKLLAVFAAKQPAFLPVMSVVEELLKPAPVNDPEHVTRVVARIKKLKTKAIGANDIEQAQIKREIEALINLIDDTDA